MIELSAETYAKNGIETILDCQGKLWLNETYIEEFRYHSFQVTAKKNTLQNTENKDMN